MLKRTFDINKINSVLKHEYIWPRIADKGIDIDTFTPPMEGVHYLHDGGALIILHAVGGKYKIHVNVVPEHRGKAETLAKEALKYAFEELGAKEVIAEIPRNYGEVYGFALKFMKDVGFSDGNHLMSLRVEEWDF